MWGGGVESGEIFRVARPKFISFAYVVALFCACGVVVLILRCAEQALAPHMSKILAIDSSKGMVDWYNATLGSERECVMGAVQGDLVAGVVGEREGRGGGTLGVPEGLGQGWALLGFCVRFQLSYLDFCMTAEVDAN